MTGDRVRERHIYMTDTQFDEKIREMLSEPQEQLPEGLWEGIESRLDAASGQRRRGTVLVRRWIAGAGAVAAAVAAWLVVAHFVPSGKVTEGEVLAENAVTEIPAEEIPTEGSAAEPDVETAGNVVDRKAAGVKAAAGCEAKFDVVKKEDAGLLAMAAESAATSEAVSEAVSAAGPETEESGNAGSRPEFEEDATRVDVDADGGDPECGLKVDNSDIEEAYGEEGRNGREGHGGIPIEITVGGNSFGGPQKSSGPRRMFTKGDKTPSGEEFVEGRNSDSFGLPLSFGVGVKYSITRWLGIGIGLSYTMLSKKVSGTYYDGNGWSCGMDMKNSQHYIGIPVDVYFSMFRTRHWDAYATVGGSVEKCVLNKYTGTFENESLRCTRKVGGVQTSVKLGLGVEFSPLEFLGIYIDPSVRYYFDNNQPRSIRTEQPLAFGVEAGVRFKL